MIVFARFKKARNRPGWRFSDNWRHVDFWLPMKSLPPPWGAGKRSLPQK